VSSSLEYEVVDVFTATAFEGNPLAVVLGADDLSTGQLQALAREFHLSETSFPMAADAEGADYRLRIFTPETELPFAGHPSVGAAEVLRRRGRIGDGRVVQSCGAGLLPLEVAGDTVTLTGGTPSYGPVLDAAPLLAAAGLSPEDLAGEVRNASCGLGFTVLPVRESALARVALDVPAVRALGLADGPFGGLSVVAWDGTSARCRVFAFEAGVAEDPATGSAALALGAWLVATGTLPDGGAYDVVQGVELGRPSLLSCTVTAVDGEPVAATVRGQVVPVAAGRIRVP
jgi:trans-2,3-dihydro-3-hydroxyanthranilate isomerase